MSRAEDLILGAVVEDASLTGERAGTGQPSFPVYTTADLKSIPPPEYLVDGFLVKGALNSLFGQYDSYKSFLSIDWSLTIAAGLGSWFGHETKAGPVVYVAGEGGSGLWQRVEAWADHRECEPPDVYWITSAVNMFQKAEAASLLAWIETLPVAPVLVVFDTTSRCSVGAEENSARDMGIVVSNMDMIRTCGAAVLAIHHTGHEHTSRERGSSGVPGAADGRVRVEKTEKLKAKIEPAKMKDSEKGEPITIHLEPRIRSLIIARAGTRTEARESSIRDKIVDYLSSHPDSTQNAIEDAVKFQRNAVRDALMALVESREVVREDGSRDSYIHSLSSAPDGSGALGRTPPGTPKTSAPAPPRSKGGALVEPPVSAPGESGRTGLEDGGW